jgi:hypothetical protein
MAPKGTASPGLPKDSKDALLDEALSGLKQMGWGASNSFAATAMSPTLHVPQPAAAKTKHATAIDPLEQLISATVSPPTHDIQTVFWYDFYGANRYRRSME